MLSQFKRVGYSQLQRWQPRHRCFGGEGLGGHLVLEVVSPQDVPDLVDRATVTGASVFAESGQPALLLDDRTRDADDLELVDVLPVGDSVAEQPQLLAEFGGITPVGFSTIGLFGLYQLNPLAAEVLEHSATSR